MGYSWRSPTITPAEEEMVEQDIAIQEIKKAMRAQDLKKNPPKPEGGECCGGRCG